MLLPEIAYPPQQGPLELPNKRVLRTAGGDTYELMATHGLAQDPQSRDQGCSTHRGISPLLRVWVPKARSGESDSH